MRIIGGVMFLGAAQILLDEQHPRHRHQQRLDAVQVLHVHRGIHDRDPFAGSEQRARDDDILETRAQSGARFRSEEHTSELQSLMRISYAVFCLKQKNTTIAATTATMTHSTYVST